MPTRDKKPLSSLLAQLRGCPGQLGLRAFSAADHAPDLRHIAHPGCKVRTGLSADQLAWRDSRGRHGAPKEDS